MSKKAKRVNSNEVRVIKLPRKAIEELLWETFMEIGEDRMEIEPNSDDVIFRMLTDDTLNEHVFYACNFSCHKTPGFSEIDSLIRERVGITSESLYTKPQTGKYYTTISIEDSKLIKSKEKYPVVLEKISTEKEMVNQVEKSII